MDSKLKEVYEKSIQNNETSVQRWSHFGFLDGLSGNKQKLCADVFDVITKEFLKDESAYSEKYLSAAYVIVREIATYVTAIAVDTHTKIAEFILSNGSEFDGILALLERGEGGCVYMNNEIEACDRMTRKGLEFLKS